MRNNLAALIIDIPDDGYPSYDLVLEAWRTIEQQYADAIGDQEYTAYMRLVRNLEHKQMNYDLMGECVYALEKVDYHPDIAALLNKLMQFDYKLDPADREKYEASLKRATKRMAGFKIDLDILTMKLEGMEAKFGAEGKTSPGEDYFESMLITLSDHVKYPVTDKIMTSEFCERVRRWNQYCEMTKSQQQSKK